MAEQIEHSESGILAGLILTIVYVITGHPTACSCRRCAVLASSLKGAVIDSIPIRRQRRRGVTAGGERHRARAEAKLGNGEAKPERSEN